MSKFRLTFTVVVEYEVGEEDHPNYPGCSTDQERLAIDLKTPRKTRSEP